MNELDPQDLRKQSNQQTSPFSFALRRIDLPENRYLTVPNTQYMFAYCKTPQSRSPTISFNNDHNPYTPSFVDNNSRIQTQLKQCEFQVHFENHTSRKKDTRAKTTDYKNKNQPIMIAQPNHKYCLVCRENFTNYFTHISHPVHLKRLTESQATQYIEDLVVLVNCKQPKPKPTLCTQRTECYSQSSISKQLVDRPSSTLFQSARKHRLRQSQHP